MKFFAIFLAIFIFSAGVVFGRNNNISKYFSDKSPSLFNSGIKTTGVPGSENISSIAMPVTPTLAAVDTLTPAPVVPDTHEDLRYPGAESVSDSGNQIVMRSSDDTDKIVDWYKKRITSEKYNINNFIVTRTNGNVADKLSAEGENGSVLIEIVKDNGNKLSTITVTVK